MAGEIEAWQKCARQKLPNSWVPDYFIITFDGGIQQMDKSLKDPKPSRFTVRVYGFLVNDKNEVLISREHIHGMDILKFPGGGVEFGEGPKDALVRELQEELELEIDVVEPVYTTDFFVQSAIDPEEQVIAMYFLVKAKKSDTDQLALEEKKDSFRGTETTVKREWVSVKDLEENALTFETDKRAWREFRRQREAEATRY